MFLQDLCYRYDIKESSFDGVRKEYEIDDSNPFYNYDPNKCIQCGRCVNVCAELQGMSAIGFVDRV